MTDFRVESTRGELVESVHTVSAAVVDRSGALIASAGDPSLVTYWRSAAKPFQALPLVRDGAADRWALSDEELALACASHSSERIHRELVERFLRKIGCTEHDLACGPHPPLSSAVAETVARTGAALTPVWSNCSGKHTGMLALALHHGWPTAGYEQANHPVQQRILAEIAEWTGVPRDDIVVAVDGCTAACFALPLAGMAVAYMRLATSPDAAAARIRGAMMAHPVLVAGTGRCCTDLMRAWPGEIVAKVGAEGVYGAALPRLGYGIAVKVEDGDMRAAPVALIAVLRQLAARCDLAGAGALAAASLAAHAEPAIRNTRGAITGVLRPAGALRFSGDAGGETMSADAGNGLS